MKIKVKVIQLPCSKDIQIKTFSNCFSLETARLNEAKFHVAPPCDGGMKVTTNALCHMTKMAAMPTYGKTVTHLIWNQKAHHLETWYAALVTQVLPGMLKC